MSSPVPECIGNVKSLKYVAELGWTENGQTVVSVCHFATYPQSQYDCIVDSFPGNVWTVFRLGLVDDYGFFRIEQPGPEFFDITAA